MVMPSGCTNARQFQRASLTQRRKGAKQGDREKKESTKDTKKSKIRSCLSCFSWTILLVGSLRVAALRASYCARSDGTMSVWPWRNSCPRQGGCGGSVLRGGRWLMPPILVTHRVPRHLHGNRKKTPNHLFLCCALKICGCLVKAFW